MFEFLFLDLDDTILDFKKAEHLAVAKTLETIGITPTEAVCDRYSRINKAHWERLERGELTRDQVMVGRFSALLAELGVDADPKACSDAYAANLAVGHFFLPGAREAVERLSKKYRLFLASNGNASVQAGRLKSAGIGRFFENIFISQEVGADKPSAEFFRRCFARIPGFDPSGALMVGDSLTSDILGANNAGIAACWVNPHGLPRRADIRVDYEIRGICQLEGLLNQVKSL